MANKKNKARTPSKPEKKTNRPSNLYIAFIIISAILILSLVLSQFKF